MSALRSITRILNEFKDESALHQIRENGDVTGLSTIVLLSKLGRDVPHTITLRVSSPWMVSLPVIFDAEKIEYGERLRPELAGSKQVYPVGQVSVPRSYDRDKVLETVERAVSPSLEIETENYLLATKVATGPVAIMSALMILSNMDPYEIDL